MIVRVELGKARFVLFHIKNNLREGFYFSLSPSSQSVYNDFDKSILPKYASLEIAGNYSAAYKIIDALCIPIKAMLQTFFARFFIKGADGLNASRKFACKLFPVFFLYSVLAVLFLILFSRYIPLLFGNSYKEAENIIMILSPVIVFRAVHSLGADTLTGAGMQGKRSIIQVMVAILNTVMCLMLIPMYGWLGAAWASLVSDGILAFLIWIIIFSSSQPGQPLQKLMDMEEPILVEPTVD
jgi:O-antigen/teichoic acid export membrane protein